MAATKEIIEKVAKLLALAAGRGTTPEEAATAAATAQRLMLRHRIEQAEIAQLEADDPIGFSSAPVGLEGGAAGFVFQTKRWQLDLLKAIGRANGCMPVITRKERSGQWLELVGRQSDLEVCRYLWAYLSGEIERLKTEQTRGWSQTRKSHFCLGAVHTVGAALACEMAAASSADGATSGAMVVSSRFAAAQAWYFEGQPNARFVRPRRTYVDAQSYQAGQTAGAGVSIRKGVSTTTHPQRLLT